MERFHLILFYPHTFMKRQMADINRVAWERKVLLEAIADYLDLFSISLVSDGFCCY